MPPRIEREPQPGLPPRIEREPAQGLPPRIERGPEEAAPPRIEREPYVPKHARMPEPPVEPPPRVEEPLPAVDEPASAVDGPPFPGDEAPASAEPEAPVLAEEAATTEPAPEPEPERVPVVRTAAPARAPERSPVREALRSHAWLTGIVLAVLIVGATGYWALRVHPRIGETSLEQGIANRDNASTVRCKPLQENRSAWACGVFHRVESVCLIARVNILGSWTTVVGHLRCAREPELAALVPKEVTAAGVAADIDNQLGPAGTVCEKQPGHKVRWACERPGANNACVLVRVIVWVPWNEQDGKDLCRHLPDLQAKVKAAS
jgi:hypothetical protein